MASRLKLVPLEEEEFINEHEFAFVMDALALYSTSFTTITLQIDEVDTVRGNLELEPGLTIIYFDYISLGNIILI